MVDDGIDSEVLVGRVWRILCEEEGGCMALQDYPQQYQDIMVELILTIDIWVF